MLNNNMLVPEVAAVQEIESIEILNDYIFISLNLKNDNIKDIIKSKNININNIDKCTIEHLKNDRGDIQTVYVYYKDDYKTSLSISKKEYINIIKEAERRAENKLNMLINDIKKLKSNDNYILFKDNRIILSNKGYHKIDLMLSDYNFKTLTEQQKEVIENKSDVYIRTIESINFNNILDNFININKEVEIIGRRLYLSYKKIDIEIRYKYTQENSNIFKVVISEPNKETLFYKELSEFAVISLLKDFFINY